MPGTELAEAFDRFWNVDLQMLQALVRPWPPGWPTHAHDLNRAAAAAGVEIPPRSADHFHPRVHAEWNRRLFERIHLAGGVRAYAAAKREAARLATGLSLDEPPVGRGPRSLP